jgi:hypothetical protein
VVIILRNIVDWNLFHIAGSGYDNEERDDDMVFTSAQSLDICTWNGLLLCIDDIFPNLSEMTLECLMIS